MKHPSLALSACLLAASTALAFAQQPPAPAAPPPGPPPHAAPPPPGDRRPPPPRFSAEDAAAFSEARTEARIAALKAGLRMTPDQDKLWPAFESALRAQAKGRADWIASRRAEWASRERPQPGERRQPVDPVKVMRDQATLATTRAAELTKLADAAEPLVKSLDESQLRRFNALMRPERGRFARNEGFQHRWRGGEGRGRD
ncbi:MAG: hypothetical protein BGP06_02200 [Rhizobiales bacterium 65-9]|nr:Spy/CpxP family protein refolding chaperone [Hyphomicrobiales bacterium]OJY34291.1 MAG: hypothetical protein BGP06_02200 [Rhizobiales bacterium 65-9]